MIQITVTVEYNLGDTCFESNLSYFLANLGSLLFLRHFFHAKRRSGNQSTAFIVIDYLDVDLLVAPKYT